MVKKLQQQMVFSSHLHDLCLCESLPEVVSSASAFSLFWRGRRIPHVHHNPGGGGAAQSVAKEVVAADRDLQEGRLAGVWKRRSLNLVFPAKYDSCLYLSQPMASFLARPATALRRRPPCPPRAPPPRRRRPSAPPAAPGWRSAWRTGAGAETPAAGASPCERPGAGRRPRSPAPAGCTWPGVGGGRCQSPGNVNVQN